MAMVVVDDSSLKATAHSPSHVAWFEGQRPLGAVLHSSNEPSELSQWPCGHDDSTINIVMGIIIIIMAIMVIIIIIIIIIFIHLTYGSSK